MGNVIKLNQVTIVSYPNITYYLLFQDSRDKKTPIVIASEASRWELVKILYSKGADLNIGTLTNMQPIHCACSANNVEMVRWLYEHGALPNQRLANGGNEKSMTKSQEVSMFAFS